MRYDLNRQRMIDDLMCKPGYVWNDTLQRCLRWGPGASDSKSAPKITNDAENLAENTIESVESANPEQNIANEVAKRAMQAAKTRSKSNFVE